MMFNTTFNFTSDWSPLFALWMDEDGFTINYQDFSNISLKHLNLFLLLEEPSRGKGDKGTKWIDD